MKLLGLDLMAFGPFTEVTLDFGNDGADFHVVLGGNEAGKSCALRALSALLYGVPERTVDNFVHDNSRLRIGGHLRRGDGEELRIVRRKGRKNTLADPDGEALAESVLEALLGGVDSPRFSTVFGIDHEALARGAQEILRSGGEVGQSLFAAGLGAVSLRDVLDSLDHEAQELFKPRGSKPAINKAVGEFKKAVKMARDLSLSSREWAQRYKSLAKLKERRTPLADEIEGLGTERSRLERLLQVLPKLGRRRELLAALAVLDGVVVLGPEFAERRHKAVRDLETACEVQRKAEGGRTRLQDKATKLSVPTELLGEAVAVTALHKGLGKHQAAAEDALRLRGKRDQDRADAKALLAELGFDVPLDDVETLRPGAALKARIQELAQQHGALVEGPEEAKRQADKHKRALEDADAALEGLPARRDAAVLRSTVDRQRRRGDLGAAEHQIGRERDAAHEEAQVALNALGLWTGTLEAVEKLAVPAAETVDRFRDGLQKLEHQRAQLDADTGKLRAEEDELAEQLEILRREGDVPTEDDLTGTRERRQSGWQLVRRAWLEGQDVAEAARELDPDRELPAAFEHSVEQADEVADRLRREADRVAKKAELEARADRLGEEHDRLRRERETLAEDEDKSRAAWAELWAPLGIAPLPPREMAAWLTRHAELATQARAERELAARVRAHGEDIAAHREELARDLEGLGEAGPGEDETLVALLDRAQRVADAIEQRERERNELAAEVLRLMRELEAARREEADKLARHESWLSDWDGSVEALGLAATASPAEANAVLDKLTDLFAKTKGADGYQNRISAIERDAVEFVGKVAALVRRAAPELTDRPEDQAVAELHRRFTDAKVTAERADELGLQIDAHETELAEAKETITLANERLDELCRQVGCEDHAQLEAAQERSEERQKLEEALEELDIQLGELGGGATVAELMAQAEDVDLDALPARITELEHESAELEKQRTELDQRIGSERTELSRLDGSAEAAEAAERAQGLLAEARTHVERYVRLRLASELLRREIERYREENQGPVLSRAQELFATLTLDSFTALRTDFDAGDEPVIVGVRESGERVGVAGMSDGTRDQLYLAIRLATLERYFDVHEPFPFVVDDILIRFDDDRSLAALRVLAELSKKTQVFFFTHHARLAELARSLGDGAAQIHDLTR